MTRSKERKIKEQAQRIEQLETAIKHQRLGYGVENGILAKRVEGGAGLPKLF